MDEITKKALKKSRFVLAIISFASLIIIGIQNWNILQTIFNATLFTLLIFCLSFISSIFCSKIINIGNKINYTIIKIIYYLILPLFCGVLIAIILLLVDDLEGILFIIPLLFIISCIFMPLVQTYIVLSIVWDGRKSLK